jgi:hypothetical protein
MYLPLAVLREEVSSYEATILKAEQKTLAIQTP